jgi:hypothetical protein
MTQTAVVGVLANNGKKPTTAKSHWFHNQWLFAVVGDKVLNSDLVQMENLPKASHLYRREIKLYL